MRARRFQHGNLNVLRPKTAFLMKAFEKKADQSLFSLCRTPLKHMDLDNSILLRTIRRKEKVRRIHRKEALKTFVYRKVKSLHNAGVNYLGQALLPRLQLFCNTIDLDLRHIPLPSKSRWIPSHCRDCA